jgi:hypothetical protein
MAEFTFNLDQLKSSASKVTGSIDSGLYSKTRDEDLTYIGNDTIVWDRTNAERLRRGLSSLTDLGLTRPPDDSPATATTPTNADGTAKTFVIKGPPGLTREQAFEIFKKQANTGGLVGFKPGETLSAATQAADGLAEAQATLSQSQSGLPSIGSLSSAGAAFAGAGGALNGSLAQSASGLTATVGPAISAASGALGSGSGISSAFNTAIASAKGASQAGSALVGAAATQGSVAVTSIQTINKVITSLPVTAPINTADFTKISAGLKTCSAVSPIGPMSIPEVNGVLAQAKNLVGQASTTLSNTKGLGEFGLNLGQLETAGYVKPGTKALLAAGANLFSNVVKSPAVWTGKDGIKSATDLLKNAPKQSQIQQDLMTKGVAGLGAVGVPIKNLSSQGIAGMSLNAAKDLPSAEAFAKGLPIPGDATGSVQAAFGSAVRDGAFAVNLVNNKIPTEFKQQDTPVPANNTVNRGTVDAASSRVIGDEKVPPPNYGPKTTVENQADVEAFVSKSIELINKYINVAGRSLSAVRVKIEALANQQSISQEAYDAVNNEFQTIRQAYNAQAPSLASEVFGIYDRLTKSQQDVVNGFPNSPVKISSLVQLIVEQSKQIKELLYQVSLKIEGRGANE